MTARLKTAEPGLSPQRQALAKAINNRDQLKTRIGHLQAAAEDMMREHWALQSDLEIAKKAVAEAENLAVQNQLNRRMNQPIVCGMSPNESRQAVDNLQDQIAEMERARKLTEQQLAALRLDLGYAESDVSKYADQVKWSDPSVMRLFQNLRTAQRTTCALRAACFAVGAPPKDLELMTVINPQFDESLAGRWENAIRLLEIDATTDFPD